MAASVDELRGRHRVLFEEVDWSAHVRAINERLGLSGRHAFVESGWAPEFFLASLPRFRPREWLAVVSLNPKEGPAEDREWYEAQRWTSDDHWRYLVREDLRGYKPKDYFYRKWAYPLLVLMHGLTGDDELLASPEEAYCYRVGAFELVPYASHEYAAGTHRLVGDDVGCEFALEAALTVIRECPPVAIIANGIDAASAVPEHLPLVGPLVEHRYGSSYRPGRMLRHWQGEVSLGDERVPYVGFPFLRSQGGHNAFDEIRQLASEIRARG